MEGFYKLDGESLLCSELVCGPTYMLIASEHATYEYPVDGWYWYEREDEARAALGFPSKLEGAFNAMTDEDKRRLLGLEA